MEGFGFLDSSLQALTLMFVAVIMGGWSLELGRLPYVYLSRTIRDSCDGLLDASFHARMIDY